ncbi:unnamed protein product [Rhizoctonia solani]|uniref:Uncharacterized protein n=1 Tax=Rhizoctonia solani TaxID=456999 RepID=A0A8H3E383_9AGAM|nr:unnamed protein product [Rhizoctonia solani]
MTMSFNMRNNTSGIHSTPVDVTGMPSGAVDKEPTADLADKLLACSITPPLATEPADQVETDGLHLCIDCEAAKYRAWVQKSLSSKWLSYSTD